MAENDFLSGLLGGVKDAGSSIYGGISGLLGGGEQTPAGGQMQDSLSMLSPADQKRLMFSSLGQIGAALLAAGARQSPESRAQALAQLGKIGPGIEESIQRTAALQQQRIAAQRQAELFPLQKQQLQGQVAAQDISQGTAILGLMGQKTNLEKNIQTLKSLGMDTTAQQRQLDIYNQYITRMAPAGVTAAMGAASPAAPAQTLPSMAAPAAPAPMAETTVPAPVQITGTELPPPVAGTPTPVVPAPAAVPVPAAPQLTQTQQILKERFPYIPLDRSMSELTTGGDAAASLQKLIDLNEKNKADQMKSEGELRKEFSPKAERYNAIQTAFATLPTLKDLKSGVADHALILSYYKIFDPSSVVSSTESGQISASSNSIPEGLQQRLNKALTGESLSPEMREKIYAAAKAKFMAEYDSYERAFDQARGTAKEFVDPNRAIPDVRDPKIMGQVTFERERDAISRALTPDDISSITNATQLENVNKALLSPAARKIYDSKYKEIYTQMLEVPPPVAAEPRQPPAIPQKRTGYYDLMPWTAANPNKPAFGGF
jgi:hypothetical protein